MNDAHERALARLVSFDEFRSREKFNLLRGLKDYFFSEPLLDPKSEVLPTTIFSSFVDEHNPKVLPPLQIYANIFAAVMRSNRAIRNHDAFDFIHAATAIPYCDAFFVNTFRPLLQIPLHDFTQHMDENFVHLLDARSAVAGCKEIKRGVAFGESAVASEQTDAFDTLTFCFFQRASDVL